MNVARSVYRWLTALYMLAIAVQLFLAASGVFREHGPGEARASSVFDPHRANGDLLILIGISILVTALVGRLDWRIPLALAVFTAIQLPLGNLSGWAGGLHGLNALVVIALGAIVSHRAWMRPRRAASGGGVDASGG